jgi:multimeric flavodoxin WrbA
VVALGLIASPRPEGNTATAVRDLLAGIRTANASAETGEVHLQGDTVAPIGDCRVCVAAGRCDRVDGFDAVMDAVYRADLLVLGTPLYWYGPSGQLKVFLDRWSCLLDLEEERFRARMRGKRVLLVVAQGERGFYEAAPCLQSLEWSVRYLDMALVGRVVVVGHARSDYAADEEQRVRVAALGASLASALDNDLMPPWFHLKYRPGDDLGGVFQPEQSEARI